MGAGRGRLLGLHSGQIVVCQLGVLVLLVTALAGAAPLWLLAVPAALLLAVLALGRLRGRWLHEWVGTGLRYALRGRVLDPGAATADLLDLVDPGAEVVAVDGPAGAYGVIRDPDGLVAVLELGEHTSLLGNTTPLVPAPAALAPPAAPDAPSVRVQILVSGAPAPALAVASGLPATSYRQLTDATVPAQARTLLAVRVCRDDAGWTDEDLYRCLASALRRVHRRLRQDGVPARPLGPRAIPALLAELAQHDPAQPVRESWPALGTGPLRQATFVLRRWPALAGPRADALTARLLALPVVAVTVALTGGTGGAALAIRLTAPDAAALVLATQALRRLLDTLGADAARLDGRQLDGLAATLPLGRGPAGVPVAVPAHAAAPAHPGHAAVPPDPVPPTALVRPTGSPADVVRTPVTCAGLMLGRNRHGHPVTVRLLRAEPTRAVLAGGVAVAALVTVRAMALGARVVVQTGRPQAWNRYIRGVTTVGDAVTLAPPGHPVPLPAATALAPQLVLVDTGPVPVDPPVPVGPWRTTLVLREDLAAPDTELLARADVVILQPLGPAEADLAGTALGLGTGQEWLTRIRDDMVGLVSRRTVRWARLSPTPIEAQVFGSLARVPAG